MVSKNEKNETNEPKDVRPDGFKLITRGHWGCKGFYMPKYFSYKTTPHHIYYMNTFTAKCDTEEECKASLSTILEKNDNKYLPRFNFVIGGDGNVYEVRGWRYSPVLPKNYKYNQSSACLLGFLGIYNESTLPEPMFDLAIKFIAFGQYHAHIKRNVDIYNIFDKTIVHAQPYQQLSESDFGYY